MLMSTSYAYSFVFTYIFLVARAIICHKIYDPLSSPALGSLGPRAKKGLNCELPNLNRKQGSFVRMKWAT